MTATIVAVSIAEAASGERCTVCDRPRGMRDGECSRYSLNAAYNVSLNADRATIGWGSKATHDLFAAWSAAERDCAAHAVNWRDLAIARRAREAALTAEVERLRAEVEVERVGNVWRKMAGDATDLAQDIADEAFGPFETQGPIESLRAIERGIAGLNEDLAAARADAANARAVATEAIDIGLSYADDAREYGFGGPAAFATLRARLASPEPAKENQ